MPFRYLHITSSFVITLLGVSAIVLGAAGETLWHVHAAAAARNNLPLPIASSVVGEANTTEAAEAESNAAMFTGDPIFKPFVMVRLPVPEGYTGGLVTDVNESGLAVGWLDDTANGERYPFVFDNAADAIHILSLPSGCTWSEATAMNNDTSTLRVVGYARIEVNSVLYDRPLQWDVDLSDWSDTRDYGTSAEYDGYMTAVNDAGSVGWYGYDVTPGNTPSMRRKVGNTIYSSQFSIPQISARMNSDHAMVGRWWEDGLENPGHACLWEHGENIVTLDPENWDYSGATDINDNFDIVGWVGESDSVRVPAIWEHDGSGWLTLNPFPGIGTTATAVAINGEREIVIAREDTVSGAALWLRVGATDQSKELRQIVLIPDTGDDGETEYIIDTATSINGRLWIGGSYVQRDASPPYTEVGEPLPCLIIPYDVNNNGEPDYREIALGIEPDLNENWLIDWAETDTQNTPSGMRLGLHGPGNIAVDGKIDPVQIVRLKVNIAPREGLHPALPDDENYVDKIVDPDPCTACQNFTQKVVDWGTGQGRPSPNTDEQCEILVRVHSMMGNSSAFGTNEGLPDGETANDEALEDIQTFGYRFAHCIDYLQWGNESFSTTSGYMFRDDELTTSGCSWSGDPKKFTELPDSSTSTACKEEAVGLVLDWQTEMMWAALRGSALAGRPLRMTTCGISSENVRKGYDAGNAQDPEQEEGYVGYLLTNALTSWANENQMYFSMHTHYKTVANAIEAIQKLVNTYNGLGSPWEVPRWRISTEVGTEADFGGDAWWSAIGYEPLSLTNTQLHNMYFWGSTDPPTGEKWEAFVDRWEAQSDNWNPVGADPGFSFANVLREFAASGFAAVCWSALQFDPGSSGTPSPFLVEALRATDLRHGGLITDPDRFTPLKTAYVNAGGDYKIDQAYFTPHECPCESGPTCPGCD